VTLGHSRPQPLAAWRPAVATSHLGRGSGLIDEHEPIGVKIQLAVEPGLTAVQDVGAALLVCVRRLF
jgi:hypothetical protein